MRRQVFLSALFFLFLASFCNPILIFQVRSSSRSFVIPQKKVIPKSQSPNTRHSFFIDRRCGRSLMQSCRNSCCCCRRRLTCCHLVLVLPGRGSELVCGLEKSGSEDWASAWVRAGVHSDLPHLHQPCSCGPCPSLDDQVPSHTHKAHKSALRAQANPLQCKTWGFRPAQI